jgi:TPR repeat protein
MNNIAFALLYGKGVEPSVEKAIEWYEKAALSGSVDAMDALGMLYEDEGHGVVDYKTSFEWYKRAADKGDYLASVAIADAYVLAKGVPKDPGKAFQLYSAIATRKQGASDGYIEFRLASAYCEGKGTARNYAECLRLARASATHDEWRGQLLLGSLYQGIYTGSGAVLTKSLVQADKWYTLACHHDDSADVKEISSEARGIESAMTDQELSQSVELSRQWTPEGSHEKTPIDDCISQRQSQAILRIRCREIYRRTSQKAISALTVLDVQQMQSCEALGLYPPQ